MKEMERNEASAIINDLEAENDVLLQVMVDAMQLTSVTNNKMATIVQAHEASGKGYEEKLVTLKNTKLPKEVLSTTLHLHSLKLIHISVDIRGCLYASIICQLSINLDKISRHIVHYNYEQ